MWTRIPDFHFDNFIFMDKSGAEEFLAEVKAVLTKYGYVTVADYYELLGRDDATMVHAKYGWLNLDSAEIKPTGEGFVINVPPVICITVERSKIDSRHQAAVVDEDMNRALLPQVLAATMPHGPDVHEQPPTTHAGKPVWDVVVEDMHKRNLMGIEKHGGPLVPFNGRDALWDAYQEALDLAVYMRQAIIERDSKTPRVAYSTVVSDKLDEIDTGRYDHTEYGD